MLLEIPVPSGNQGYWEFISSVGIFLVSFVVTANFWFNRHKIFALTEEITKNHCSRFYLYWFAFTNSAVDQMDYGCSNII
ncbi:TMEM175 family protein [Lactococcus lactis]|nr:TMEM175 family protein [Lactococcus lactis]